MIDAHKLNRAASIISKLPADDPVVVNVEVSEREGGGKAISLEYSDHAVLVRFSALQPEPYIELVQSGRLLQYFVEQSLYFEAKYQELKEAFRITFNNILEDNRKLQERIAELDEQLDKES